uniref:TNF family profile domain-containing protein n=1 Tax=Biomphalaria glabrata TaxID=6526 RepID=A0A2C9KSE1_BIOGL
MAVISFGMALVALILVSLTISNINKQENMVSSKSRFEKICLNCSLLSLPTGDTKKRRIIITDINGFKDQCCAENELELSILLDLISNVSKLQTDADISILEKGKLPISAHKSFMQTNEPGQESNDTHFVLNVDPMYNDPAIEHNSGVDLVPDGLKIIYTGIYFVYSSIEFQNAQTVSVNSVSFVIV